MNVLGVGIDVIEIWRLERALQRWGEKFIRRVFSDEEMASMGCRSKRMEHLAGRFAAKEAVIKALGLKGAGVSWRDIEVLSEPRGRPVVRLGGVSLKRAKDLNLACLEVSISHSRTMACACAIAGGDRR
ncbi:MAG: holo-ACP synthase [Clostridia bacterium]|nr:holo-ACP synthase [Clostridia bacterium]